MRNVSLFQGMDMVSKDIGNIPYNTLDSMIPMMKQYTSYRFILDNYYMIGLAQQDAGGTLKNLYPSDALSTAYNKDYR